MVKRGENLSLKMLQAGLVGSRKIVWRQRPTEATLDGMKDSIYYLKSNYHFSWGRFNTLDLGLRSGMETVDPGDITPISQPMLPVTRSPFSMEVPLIPRFIRIWLEAHTLEDSLLSYLTHHLHLLVLLLLLPTSQPHRVPQDLYCSIPLTV